MFDSTYKNRRVLVTGHTGFKGSWLVYWLQSMGADVCGYALDAPTEPSHWNLLQLDMRSEIGDIRDAQRLESVLLDFKPEMVFHLAAQPLVRDSYADPVATYSTNVMGTLHLFEACRKTDSVRAIINVTTDKCYENREWIWGYRENDPMGGYDPYSSSKGCSELLTASYRNSFFNPSEYGKSHQILLASCRAGNVIGGGDWAKDRLVPDLMRAANAGEVLEIRSPQSTRPWQHVLEPLYGYLLVGKRLLKGDVTVAEGWNFGPSDDGNISVQDVTKQLATHWDEIICSFASTPPNLHEANLLKLDCSKAHAKLGWKPVWNAFETFKKTADWYRDFYIHSKVNTSEDLQNFIKQLKTRANI